jgi:bifunctional aspartokinase / homoserine dehydrogenase 1
MRLNGSADEWKPSTPGPEGWAVNKFGGTSVASAEAMVRVRDIIAAEMDNRGSQSSMAVVVSAMGGKPKVTDLLLSTVTMAAAGDHAGYCQVLQDIRDKHTQAIADLGLSWSQASAIVASLDQDISDLKDLLRAVALMQHENERLRELVSGYGETWSSQVLCALLNASGHNFVYLNARRVVIIDEAPETGVCFFHSSINSSSLQYRCCINVDAIHAWLLQQHSNEQQCVHVHCCSMYKL